MNVDDALRDLDARVAAGQISIDEYLRQRAALTPADEPASPAQQQPSENTSPAQPGRHFGQSPPPPQGSSAAGPDGTPAYGMGAYGAAPSGPQPPAAFAVAPPGAARQAPARRPAGTGSMPPGAAAELAGPAAPQPPAGFAAVQREAGTRPNWTPPAAPTPSVSRRAARSGARPKRRALTPWIALGVLLVLVVAGAVFLTLGSGEDSPSPQPTGTDVVASDTPATSGTVPAPPAVAPFGDIPGAANKPQTTGSLSVQEALDAGVVTRPEADGLRGCGAEMGLTQELSGSGWSGRGWVFSCADAGAAQKVALNVAGYYHAQQFKDSDLGTRSVYGFAKTAGDTVVQALYVNNAMAVFLAATSPDAVTAKAQAQALLDAALDQYPSTFPTG